MGMMKEQKGAKRMRKSIFALICCIILGLTLAGCIDVESDMTVHNDGSGSMTLVYRISPVMKRMGQMGDVVNPIPLPVYKEDFEALLINQKGIIMKSHSVKEENDGTIVTASFDFTDVKALSLLGEDENSFSLKKTGETMEFIQRLPSGGADGIDSETLEMLKSYCLDNYFLYTIHTPTPITEYSLGKLGGNKKYLEYKVGIVELLTAKDGLVLSVKW
jgi:hypothetical protein